MSNDHATTMNMITIAILTIVVLVAAFKVSDLEDRVTELEQVPITTSPHTCIQPAPEPTP